MIPRLRKWRLLVPVVAGLTNEGLKVRQTRFEIREEHWNSVDHAKRDSQAVEASFVGLHAEEARVLQQEDEGDKNW